VRRHAALALCLLFLTAGTGTGSVSVSGTVTGKCSTSGGTLPFGAYSPLTGAAVDVTGSLTLQCTRGAPSVTIALDNGANSTHAVGTTRAMSGGGSYLSYEIYTSAAETTVWNATNTLSYASTTMAATSIPVYGHIPGGQDVKAASYSDSVLATVNF
jgi:spore coat protein U-like protein